MRETLGGKRRFGAGTKVAEAEPASADALLRGTAPGLEADRAWPPASSAREEAGGRTRPQARRRRARAAVNAVCTICLLASFGVLAYLNVADWYATYAAERNITRMESLFPSRDDPARLESKIQAQRYNELLAARAGAQGAGGAERAEAPRERQAGSVLPYEEQLLFDQEPMMSYVQIPKLAVKLPIYHGTAESALMAGVGHLESSSLPVGGASAHCVLMGHSGMRNARMFDDIVRLRAGDRFVIWTLGEPYAYEVCDVITVLPSEVEELIGIEAGRDLTTLVTCTPYGVNSHRLLVRAQRCDYNEELDGAAPGIVAYANARSVPLALALCVLGTLAAGAVARGIGRARMRQGQGVRARRAQRTGTQHARERHRAPYSLDGARVSPRRARKHKTVRNG